MKGLLLLFMCLLLCGCDALPRPREMGDMALLRTLGVDADGEGAVSLTASTGPRPAGSGGGEEQPLVLCGAGGSLSTARRQLEEQGESRVFSGYVDHLLLGEERPAGDALAYLARDRELGLGAWLWVVKGEASSAVEVRDAEPRLAALAKRAGEDLPLMPRRAGDVYADLLDYGTAWAPVLELREENLYPAGYAVFQRDARTGLLEGAAARGLELLAGKAEGQLLELGELVLEVTHSTLTCRRAGEELVLSCRVEAGLAEYDTPPGPEELERLEGALESLCAQEMEQTLEQLRLWGVDPLSLSRRADLADLRAWLGEDGPGLDRANVNVTGVVRP